MVLLRTSLLTGRRDAPVILVRSIRPRSLRDAGTAIQEAGPTATRAGGHAVHAAAMCPIGAPAITLGERGENNVQPDSVPTVRHPARRDAHGGSVIARSLARPATAGGCLSPSARGHRTVGTPCGEEEHSPSGAGRGLRSPLVFVARFVASTLPRTSAAFRRVLNLRRALCNKREKETAGGPRDRRRVYGSVPRETVLTGSMMTNPLRRFSIGDEQGARASLPDIPQTWEIVARFAGNLRLQTNGMCS